MKKQISAFKRRLRKKIIMILITGSMPVFFLAGCAGSTHQAATEIVSETVSLTAEALNSSMLLNDEGVKYDPPRIIEQRMTSFGDNGCGGAAGLMALQAAGYMGEADTDEEYQQFWKSVPTSSDATKGFNGNGIWNPAFADWLASIAPAQRIQSFNTDDIKSYISAGNVVIVLVSLGETGDTTHWMTVTGWKIKDGLLLFDVADPWSGAYHEYTESRLQKRMEEGSKRKEAFGAGHGTDGVVIKVKE